VVESTEEVMHEFTPDTIDVDLFNISGNGRGFQMLHAVTAQ